MMYAIRQLSVNTDEGNKLPILKAITDRRLDWWDKEHNNILLWAFDKYWHITYYYFMIFNKVIIIYQQ